LPALRWEWGSRETHTQPFPRTPARVRVRGAGGEGDSGLEADPGGGFASTHAPRPPAHPRAREGAGGEGDRG